jgi:hypothetical protein
MEKWKQAAAALDVIDAKIACAKSEQLMWSYRRAAIQSRLNKLASENNIVRLQPRQPRPFNPNPDGTPPNK